MATPPSPLAGFALPHIAPLHAYTPGLQPAGDGWVKLNTNECPYPPSPRVAEALRREIGDAGESLRLYPNPKSEPLRAAIAAVHGVGENSVCVGNGSDDILNLLVRCLGGPAAPAGFTWPSYSLYPVLVAIQDGAPAAIEFDRTMRLPAERISGSAARAFFLTSPNAPTGVGFSRREIADLLASYSGLLVVDEAYAPFAAEDAVALLGRHRNLVVVRTLSKAYALAGIRVGYALADPEVIGWLDRVRDSYNVSRLAQVAALAALGDPAYFSAPRRPGEGHPGGLSAGLDRPARAGSPILPRPTSSSPSRANARGETGPAVARSAYDFLFARKVLVRHFPSHALTASFLRISIGTDDDMLALNQTFDAWLKATPNA